LSKKVISPLPGIFYRRPAPDQPPYVKEGDKVKAGDIVGLIEVMKNFYELQTEESGIVESFLVENEGLVEAGQDIVILK
jgi:biotin carboxyl carrier protein